MDEVTEEKLEDAKDTPIEPLEVKVVNEKVKDKNVYDDEDDPFNDSIPITQEQIREFEDGDSR